MSSQKRIAANKSTSKPQSITTETRLSQSHIFNNSSLNNSAAEIAPQTNQQQSKASHYLSNNIHNSENREVEFLRIKNAQLLESTRRLEKYTRELEQEKKELLNINKKYVDVVNRYYENQNKECSVEEGKKRDHGSGSQAHKVLLRLEKDHRNLVKHCLTMQEEIKKYQIEMEKFETMKSQLRSVNHATVQDLVEEIEELAEQNKSLKKNNNQITFELQKAKMECQRVRKAQGIKEKEAGDSGAQVAKMQSQLNTVQQQSLDKTNAYESRIYDLQLKVERLEKQLRWEQQNISNTTKQNKQLSMKQVQSVHEYDKLQQSMTDLLIKNGFHRTRAQSNYGRQRGRESSFYHMQTSNKLKNKSRKSVLEL